MTNHETPFQKGAVKHRETRSDGNLDERLSKLDHLFEVIIHSQIKPPNCKQVAQRLDWKLSPPRHPPLPRGRQGVVIIFECCAGGQTLLSGSHNRSAALACLYKDTVPACEKHFWCLAGSMTHSSHMSKACWYQKVSQGDEEGHAHMCTLS